MHIKYSCYVFELEGVSSKQTYLGVLEQLITDNDNYQQVSRENCGGVIMKVITMKLQIIKLRCKHINTYSQDKCENIITYKVYIKFARFD